VIRRLATCLCLLVCAGGLTLAQVAQPEGGDDQPLRLKKKDRAADAAKEEPGKPIEQPDPPKRGEKLKIDDDPPENPDEPEMDEQEILNRILKNARTSEERLANKEVNDSTRQVQRDILKDLDSLIEQSKKPPQDNQDQGGGGGGGGQAQSGGQKDQKNGQGGGMSARAQRRQRQQQARGSGKGSKSGQGQGEAEQPQQITKGSGNQGGGGGTSKTEDVEKLAEIYKDIWGQLPEGLRLEMMAYSKEQFMDKYKDQLKKYYSTISEKGRDK
jgi:hypothetical protein